MPGQVRPPKAGSFQRKGEGRAAPIRALRGPHPLHFTLCLWYAKKALEGGRYLEELARIFAAEGIDQWGICSFQGLPLLPVGSRRRLPEDARSVIVILIGYYIGEYPNRNLSRYALVDDYHTVFGEKLGRVVENLWNLFKTHRFIQFVDASPIPEVLAAYRAGLGDVGQNGQLLNPVYGSRCFIGEIVTDLELPPFSGPVSPPAPRVLSPHRDFKRIVAAVGSPKRRGNSPLGRRGRSNWAGLCGDATAVPMPAR